MIKTIQYYIWSTYRRRILDNLQKKYSYLYHGIVLDIGGRNRGKFNKPKKKVEQWIFADIDPFYHPDILIDVCCMPQINDNSIDLINAIELFEHVLDIEKALLECYRVIKPDGKFILSVPFLYPIHADPFDFQRWTLTTWNNELQKIGFQFEQTIITGRYFTVICDMLKSLIRSMPIIMRHLLYFFYPVFDLIVLLDGTQWIKNHKVLSNYHGGYFFCLKKPEI
jgi:SAM-dependent methyltransferase